MEIFMDGNSHIMTNTHHGTKSIGAQTEMGILTHSLKALSLLLHWIIIATQAINLYAFTLNFTGLTCPLTFHQFTHSTDTGTCGNLLQQVFIYLVWSYNYLYVLNCRAIIQCNEIYSLTATMSAHPSLYIYSSTKVCSL